MEPSFQTDFLWHLAYLKTCIYKTLQIMIQKLTPPPFFFFFLSWTEELTKAGTCARDRHALQQLALNVHVKHSDLTWLRMMVIICLPLVGLGTVQDVCCAVSICHDTIKLTFFFLAEIFFFLRVGVGMRVGFILQTGNIQKLITTTPESYRKL